MKFVGNPTYIIPGETLAAIEMISSIGVCISPVIMGSILTASVSSVFFCMDRPDNSNL